MLAHIPPHTEALCTTGSMSYVLTVEPPLFTEALAIHYYTGLTIKIGL